MTDNIDKALSEKAAEMLVKVMKPLFDSQKHIQLGKTRIYTNYIKELNEIRFDMADGNDQVPHSDWLPRSVTNFTIEEATQLRDKLNEMLIEAQLT